MTAADILRRLYERTPAMLYSMDAQGRLLEVTDHWLSRMGYRREEVLGRPWDEFLTPASLEYAKTIGRPALFSRDQSDQVEYQMLTKSGERLDVLTSARLERNAAGEVLRIIALSEDVSPRRQAERALNDERQRLAYILQATHAGTWEWNVRSDEARFNEQWAAIIGMAPQELGPATTMQLWRDHLHPDDLPHTQALLQRQHAGELPRFEVEHRALHRDGQWRWVVDCGCVLTRGADGAPEWMYGTRQDISARRQQEQALSSSQAELHRTGRLAGVGGWDVGLDSFHVNWSDETCRIHGVPAGHRPSREEAMNFIAPEAWPQIESAMNRCAQFGEAWDLELPCIRADGARIWVRVLGSLERDASGRPIRLVGAMQDVTERLAQRRAIEEARDRMALATDSGGIGIWEQDFLTGELNWDGWMFRLFGHTEASRPRADSVLALWNEAIHPDDRARVEREHSAALSGRAALDTEFRIHWPDGSEHHLRAAARVAQGVDGRATRMVGSCWDVTAQRALAQEVADQHQLLQVTLNSIADAVITTDPSGAVNWLNPVAERLTGWLSAEAHGRALDHVCQIVAEDSIQPVPNPVLACLQLGAPPPGPPQPTGGSGPSPTGALPPHSVLRSRGGLEFGIEGSAAPIRDAHGVTLGAVLVFRDVTESRRLSGEMHHRATHDALTGLVNRAEFDQRLRRAWHGARDDRRVHALMFIDLDQFKLINDACGHSVGDQLLQQISRLLTDTVRARDTLARLGGDEFAVILEHCNTEQALRVAQKICDRVDEFRFAHDGRRLRVGASIGLVPVDERWSGTAAILQAADSACYAAKEAGRNRVHVWYDTDAAIRSRHGEMRWATRLEQALDEDRFTLFGHRIEAVQTGPGAAGPADAAFPAGGVHAEVLLRLLEADGSLVPPGAFLPAAERFHMAARIDRWVLRHVIAWIDTPARLAAIQTLSVNLSGQSIGDKAFQREALEMLGQAGHEVARRLCIEITETAAITNLGEAAAFIEQLRAMGVRVALDDFGAGSSSFGYLKTLRVDYLKIDGQFIRDLIDDRLDDAAVRCFVDVAKVVGIQTVAEFVERADVLTRLREIGIDHAQGYLLHQPEPLDEMMRRCGVPLAATAQPAPVAS